MKINKEWHIAHQMPVHANMEQRIGWHIEHTKKCNCPDIPARLKEEMRRRKIKV